MKKLLLLVLSLAFTAGTMNAQTEYGNTTTAIEEAHTWDFYGDGTTVGEMFTTYKISASKITEDITVDNLYFGASSETPLGVSSHRLVLSQPTNQTFLADDSKDGVLSFKVKGKGSFTVTFKTPSTSRFGLVYLGDQQYTDSIDTLRTTYKGSEEEKTYEYDVDEVTSVYLIGGPKCATNRNKYYGPMIYKITVTPENATGIVAIEDKKKKEDDAYYNLQGMRVASPKKGVYIHQGKKIMIR